MSETVLFRATHFFQKESKLLLYIYSSLIEKYYSNISRNNYLPPSSIKQTSPIVFSKGENQRFLYILLISFASFTYKEHCQCTISNVCQWLATGRWFSPGTPVSSTNKTDHHDIAEILFKVALNTNYLPPSSIKQTSPIVFSKGENQRFLYILLISFASFTYKELKKNSQHIPYWSA
jgi:hypothetical protein